MNVRGNSGTIFNGTPDINAGRDINIGGTIENKFTCLQHLRQTDPRDDKSRIKNEKGAPLEGSYEWILEDPVFEVWEQADSGVLWIRGEPGKVLTISHFICENGHSLHNNSISVIRGLLFMLLDQREDLLGYLKHTFQTAGPRLFEDGDRNLFFTLKRLLLEILKDDSLGTVCFLVDALDECETGLDNLMHLIIETSEINGVLWVITSRKTPITLEPFVPLSLIIDLEANHHRVKEAVHMYINKSVQQFKGDEDFQHDAAQMLKDKSQGTFLWVHLVCKRLAIVPEEDFLDELEQFPAGLDAFYERMFQQIPSHNINDLKLCHQILALVLVTYRPLRLAEMVHVLDIPAGLSEYLRKISSPNEFMEKKVRGLVAQCGSFLSLREDTVSLIHKSVEDFLRAQKQPDLLCAEERVFHRQIGQKCINILSQRLKRDVLSLRDPAVSYQKICAGIKATIQDIDYAVSFWASHVVGGKNEVGQFQNSSSRNLVLSFLKAHFLHWVEVLSILGKVHYALLELNILSNTHLSGLSELVPEMVSFIRRYHATITTFPLQLYYGLRLFSSSRGEIGEALNNESIQMNLLPRFESLNSLGLDECLMMIEHDDPPHAFQLMEARSIAISPNRLASIGRLSVQVWDTSTGIPQRILRVEEPDLCALELASDDKRLFAANFEKMVVCDIASGSCQVIHFNEPFSEPRIDTASWYIQGPETLSIATIDPHGLKICLDGFRFSKLQHDLLDLSSQLSKRPLSDVPELESIANRFSDHSFICGIGLLNETDYMVAWCKISKVPEKESSLSIFESKTGHCTTLWVSQDAEPAKYANYNSHRPDFHPPDRATVKFFFSDNFRIVVTRSQLQGGQFGVWEMTGTGSEYHGFVNTNCTKEVPVAYIPRCQALVTISGSTEIKFWTINKEERTYPPLCIFHGHEAIYEARISTDFSRLVSAAIGPTQGTVRIWNMQKLVTNNMLATTFGINHENPDLCENSDTDAYPNSTNNFNIEGLSNLILSPCGSFALIFYSKADATLSACVYHGWFHIIEVVSVATGRRLFTIPYTATDPGDIIWKYDGKLFMQMQKSGSGSSDINIWDLEAGYCIQTISLKTLVDSIRDVWNALNERSIRFLFPVIRWSEASETLVIIYRIPDPPLWPAQPYDITWNNAFKLQVNIYHAKYQIDQIKLSHIWAIEYKLIGVPYLIEPWGASHIWEDARWVAAKFSPKGNLLAIIVTGTLLILDLDFRALYRSDRGDKGRNYVIETYFSPDGRFLMALEITGTAIDPIYFISAICLNRRKVVHRFGPIPSLAPSWDQSAWEFFTLDNRSYFRMKNMIYLLDLNEVDLDFNNICLFVRGFDFSENLEWLRLDFQPFVWIPHHYRPVNRNAWKARENTVTVVSQSGTYRIEFDKDKLPVLFKEAYHFEALRTVPVSFTLEDAVINVTSDSS